MRKVTLLLVLIFSLSLFSVPFGATAQVTATSPARLLDEMIGSENGTIVNIPEDMLFSADCPSAYIGKSRVIRSSSSLPVTLDEGRFTVDGKEEQISVTFENIDFVSNGLSETPAVYVSGNVALTFKGCSFRGYTDSAVRIVAEDEDTIFVTFGNCVFENNSATQGGGVYAKGRGRNLTLSMSGCSMKACVAEMGGGLWAEGCKVTLTDCVFEDNFSSNGGGIFFGEGDISITRTEIFGNVSKGFGGGISLYDGNLTLLDCVLSRNVAEKEGGAISMTGVLHILKPGDEDLLLDYTRLPQRGLRADNTSFYLNGGENYPTVYITDGQYLDRVDIRLSTFAYNDSFSGAADPFYEYEFAQLFGCILESDGLKKQLPNARNSYCLTYWSEEETEVFLPSESTLSGMEHLNCSNDSPLLRIPENRVKEIYNDEFRSFYGSFPVGDNYGEVILLFPFFPLRTEDVKVTRGTPIPEIPAPMRDMYDFGGWYYPEGHSLSGYRLLIGGDLTEIEFSPLWTLNVRFYMTLAGVGFVIACGAVGWIVVRKRMKKVNAENKE